MTVRETICQNLPALSPDEIDDALFRGRDRAWVAAAGLFDQKREKQKLSYQALADRIGRKKSQVHYWLGGSCNMTLKTLGLLAEGMDADLEINLMPRFEPTDRANYCHPSASAASAIYLRAVFAKTETVHPPVEHKTSMSFSIDWEGEL